MSTRWANDVTAWADDFYWADDSGSLNDGEAYWGDEDFEASAVTLPTITALMVDWDGDGNYGENEWTYRMLDFEIERGREFLLDSEGGGFQEVMVGRLRVELKNIDGRYDPYNSSSPLYGKLSKNQKVIVIVQDESTGTQYTLFTGYISDIKPNFGAVDSVTIRAEDAGRKLRDTIVRSSVSTTTQYDTAISNVLTQAGWTDSTDIDTTLSDTMAYYWMSGRSAWNELMDLTNATLGLFYISVDGVPTYLSRVSGDTSAVTLTDDDWQYHYGVRVRTPREVVRNRIRVYARARSAVSDATVWTALDKPQILAGASITVWADFSYNGEQVPATAITAPVENTDYEANTDQLGGGTDKSSFVTVDLTEFATSAKLIYTNTNSTAFYMTLMQLRANIVQADAYTFAEDTDATSISTYGERELIIKTDWLQDINSAIEHADLLINKLGSPRRYPRIQMKANPSKQFRELFELVTLDFTTKGISEEQRVGYIRHSTSAKKAGIFITELHFEPNLFGFTSGTWTFTTTFPAVFP